MRGDHNYTDLWTDVSGSLHLCSVYTIYSYDILWYDYHDVLCIHGQPDKSKPMDSSHRPSGNTDLPLNVFLRAFCRTVLFTNCIALWIFRRRCATKNGPLLMGVKPHLSPMFRIAVSDNSSVVTDRFWYYCALWFLLLTRFPCQLPQLLMTLHPWHPD